MCVEWKFDLIVILLLNKKQQCIMNIDINQNLSPIKYFLLIKPNSRNSLKDSIKCLFSTWCGTYSPIYPFYSRLSGKFSDRYNVKIDKDIYYKNLIVNYDPDVIVYEDGLDIDRITKLADGRNIILLSSFKEQLNFGKLEYGISIDKVINGIIDEEFKYKRQDNLKLKFPNNKNNNLLLDAWQGVLLDNVEDKYLNKYLKKKSFIEQIDLERNF